VGAAASPLAAEVLVGAERAGTAQFLSSPLLGAESDSKRGPSVGGYCAR